MRSSFGRISSQAQTLFLNENCEPAAVRSLVVSNTAEQNVTVDLSLVRSGASFSILDSLVIQRGKSFVSNQKKLFLHLEPGDGLEFQCSLNQGADFVLSYDLEDIGCTSSSSSDEFSSSSSSSSSSDNPINCDYACYKLICPEAECDLVLVGCPDPSDPCVEAGNCCSLLGLFDTNDCAGASCPSSSSSSSDESSSSSSSSIEGCSCESCEDCALACAGEPTWNIEDCVLIPKSMTSGIYNGQQGPTRKTFFIEDDGKLPGDIPDFDQDIYLPKRLNLNISSCALNLDLEFIHSSDFTWIADIPLEYQGFPTASLSFQTTQYGIASLDLYIYLANVGIGVYENSTGIFSPQHNPRIPLSVRYMKEYGYYTFTKSTIRHGYHAICDDNNNCEKRLACAVPFLPNSCFIFDENGNYVVDDNGNYEMSESYYFADLDMSEDCDGGGTVTFVCSEIDNTKNWTCDGAWWDPDLGEFGNWSYEGSPWNEVGNSFSITLTAENTCRPPDPCPASGACRNEFELEDLDQIDGPCDKCECDGGGRPLDIDVACDGKVRPGGADFASSIQTYTLWFQPRGLGAVPVISNVLYDTTMLDPSLDIVRIHTASTPESMRDWVCANLRFVTVEDYENLRINTDCAVRSNWPYNDLYWGGSCAGYESSHPNDVPIDLVPC